MPKNFYNFPGTNKLNWVSIRGEIITPEIIGVLMASDWKGEVIGEWGVHNKMNLIKERLAKVEAINIESCNLYMYVLVTTR